MAWEQGEDGISGKLIVALIVGLVVILLLVVTAFTLIRIEDVRNNPTPSSQPLETDKNIGMVGV
jgi:hypothetical protein